MNKTEYENLIDEKLASVKEELMREFKEEKKNEYPIVGTVYYYTNNKGDIYKSRWEEHPIDKDRFAIGNRFETKEEAEFKIERLKVIAELKRFAEPKERAWNFENKHWYLLSDIEDANIRYDYNWSIKRPDIYFASEEDARKAVEAVGVERVKKYYLEVTE